MENLQALGSLLEKHLQSAKVRTRLWRLHKSQTGGRGLFANRDIHPGEVIFTDLPLLIGPKAGEHIPFSCVVCAEISSRACSVGCGLPVCSVACEKLQQDECKFIRDRLGAVSVHPNRDLYRALAPVRGLFLNGEQKELLKKLVCYLQHPHGFEVNLVKELLHLSAEEQDFMRVVCGVFDSNAFEVRKNESNVVTLRGLFPLSALLNHSCVPHTTHSFDAEKNMIVKASVPIKKDEEIFITYSSFFWGTSTRRHFLARTKHFWCNCQRCLDPKEFGSGLNGLKCTLPNCKGVLYPLDPLHDSSKWQCDSCNTLVSSKKVGYIQTALGSAMSNLNSKDVHVIVDMLRNQLEHVVPKRSQLVTETKMRLVWILGHTENYTWHELNDDLLDLKEDICRDLLELLSILKLGQCRMRALLLMELHRCLVEKSLRKTVIEDIKVAEDIQQEQRAMLKEATDILSTDVSSVGAPDLANAPDRMFAYDFV